MQKNTENLTTVGRRRFLQFLGAGATFAFPGWVLGKNALWVPENLPLTPTQTEGPFYPEVPIEKQLFNDTDLRRKVGNHDFAKGKQVTVGGVVKDQTGRPLSGSVVEIWQACETGRYNHTRDAKNPSLLDNNFQFWGRAITGKDGKYAFQTIVPGMYSGRNGRHIHFRIDSPGFKRLSTQCYFADYGADNDRDSIYKKLSSQERKLVTVEFDHSEADVPKGKSRNGNFDLVLAKRSA